MGTVKPRDAIIASANRGVVLPDVYYGKMHGIERAEAFSIAGIAKLDQLQLAINSLTTAIHGGMSFEQWKREALKAEDVAALPAHRLDNIFRTNIQGAYARGKCVHIANNQDARPFLMYTAINDSRTRPAHAAMSGHVAKADDPIWKAWMPPCGYRCRCTVISLSPTQAEKRKTKDDERLAKDADAAQAREAARQGGPDEGWDYSPCENPDPTVQQAINQRKAAIAAVFGPKIEKLQQAAAAIAASGDFAAWTKIEGRKGTNPGGVYQAPDGRKWYVKEYSNPDQARSEMAAQGIYKMMGIETPNQMLVTHQGKTILASEWIDDLATLPADVLAKKHATDLARIYATSALVKNWDVVGQTMDNLARTKGGKLIVIDAGGSFKFKAQGAFKEFMAGPVEEVSVMINPNRTAGKVFSQLPEAKRNAAIKLLDGITKKALQENFQLAGFSAEEVKALTDATWARRKWMLETLNNKSVKAIRTATLNVDEAINILGATPTYPTPRGGSGNVMLASLGHDPASVKSKISRLAKDYSWGKDESPFKASIWAYTTSDYRNINPLLWDAATNGHQAASRVAAVINQGLSMMPKYSGPVARGVRSMDPAYVNIAREAHKTGKPVELWGFQSADTTGGWKKQIVLHIDAKGLQGVDIDHLSAAKGELEVLFPHKARFFVRKVEQDKYGKTHIHVEESVDALTGEALKLESSSRMICDVDGGRCSISRAIADKPSR
jgi:SPP1 gp7 family putative phage head morphogenesis protein